MPDPEQDEAVALRAAALARINVALEAAIASGDTEEAKALEVIQEDAQAALEAHLNDPDDGA